MRGILHRDLKTANILLVFTGVGMMIYPYFTSGWLQDWGVGLGLCGLLIPLAIRPTDGGQYGSHVERASKNMT